jgi:hypothetical protein
MAVQMTREQADAVFDVLVEHAGASDGWRDDFVERQVAGSTDEYRFQGLLGFGGKFWNCNGRWYVSAYPEDVKRRPEMRQAIDATNEALAALKERSIR